MLGMEAAPPAPAQDVRAFEGYVKWERLQEDAKLPRHDTTRPQARHGHRCVLVDSKRGAERGIPGGPQMLSIFGGDRGLMGDFWAYGIESRTWREVDVDPRDAKTVRPSAAFAIATAGNKVYMYGGVQEGRHHDRMSDEVYELDTSSMRYRVLYTTPGNRDPSEDREGEAHPDFCLGACMVHVPNLEGGGPGELWVFGGLNHEHAPLNQLLTFDLETKEWARIDPAGERTPENRESASMVFWDDDGTRKLILYGGMIGDSDLNRERVSDVWALHIDENPPRWEELIPHHKSNQPTGRSLHTAMIVYDKMVVYGGWSENGDRNLWQADSVIRILNLKTLTWELRDAPKSGAGSEKPPPRAGHGAIMYGSDLYVFGGNVTHKGDVRCGNDLWRGTAVPPFPCRDVEVTEISATEAVVTWENPFPQQVGGYTVLVKKHDSDEEAVEYPVPEGNGLREVLRNLKPDTRYTVDVRARNSAGESSWWGTPETGSFKTPGGVPAKPRIELLQHSMETLCVKLAAEKDGGIPANEMVVQIAVGRIEEVSEQAAPTSKKQKGGRSSVAPIGFAQTVDEPDFLEFPLPAGSMLEIAEQQVVDEVIAPSAPWLAAEKVLEKEASRYHETKQIEAGQSVGKKRARPVDHGSYTSKGAGEVSATFRITLQVRVVARNQTGSSDVSETSTIAIERAASKPVPEVASPAPIAVPPVDDVDVVMATEGADGPGKSDSMEELVRKVPIFQQLVENYTGEEEDEAMVEEPVHLAAAATPSRSELRDSEIVPETPVAHAPKADIPAALAPAKPSSPIRNGWNLPVNAEAAPSEVAPETEPDEVIEEAAGSVKRVSGRQSTEPDEEEGAGSVLVQPTPEPTAEPALEQAEELAPEPAAEPAAESVPEPAPQQPVEMEVHQATSKKAVKSRQSLPANFAVGPKETATKTPSGKRPPAKKEAATTVKKGRKSAAMDDEPVESEPVIAKPVKAAPKPESSAPPSWDPLALRFGDDVNLIFDEFNRPFFYKALWYCDADLLTGPFGKKEVVDTGKVLVLHGAGFGADNLVWVFLNEEGLRSLTPGDVSKVDPLDMPEKLNWDELKAVFNVKSHDFFFGLPETWGIRQEDLPAIRDGPWHRKIWSVKRAPQHVIMAQKGNIKANVESAFKKARKSGVGTDLAPVADKPTPKRNVKAKKEKDAAGTDEEETY